MMKLIIGLLLGTKMVTHLDQNQALKVWVNINQLLKKIKLI